MKTAMLIVNGLRFRYVLVDHAIAWSKQEGASLRALFITSGKEVPEGYIFPSDIDEAESLKDEMDSEKDSIAIFRDQMKLFEDMAKAQGVPGQAEFMLNPSLQQVLEKIKTATILFVAPEEDVDSLLAVSSFSMEELVESAPCPVKVIASDNK